MRGSRITASWIVAMNAASACGRRPFACFVNRRSSRKTACRKGRIRSVWNSQSASAASEVEPGFSSVHGRPRVSGGGLLLPQSDEGTPPIRSVAAPMVAASDYAFRCLCRQHGVDLTFTQMLHARNLVGDKVFARSHLDLYEYCHPATCSTPSSLAPLPPLPLLESQRNLLQDPMNSRNGDHLSAVRDDWAQFTRGPVVVQLAGHDADLVAAAAQMIVDKTEGRVAGIDLNLGCPQGIARKGNYGGFLMERDVGLACRILALLRRSLPRGVSVSAKIRLPAEDAALRDRVRRLLDTGINFLTIHGRTLVENKTKASACDLDRIRLAVDEAQRHRPGFMVVANGGIEGLPDVSRVRDLTGAVAVMSSEALLECPNVFLADASSLAPRERLEQQFGFARDYLAWCRAYPPLPGVLGHDGGSFNIARGHLFKFLHRYLQEHHDVRDQLASHQLRTLWQAKELVGLLYQRYDGLTDCDLSGLASGKATSSWYRRHWNGKANLRVHHRHSAAPLIDSRSATNEISLEQRKVAIRGRIEQMQERKRRKLGRG